MRYIDYINCCLYRVDPPDDEQQACSKYVDVYCVKNFLPRNKIQSTVPVYTTRKSAKTLRNMPAFRINISAE